jgi:hypothetical protein
MYDDTILSSNNMNGDVAVCVWKLQDAHLYTYVFYVVWGMYFYIILLVLFIHSINRICEPKNMLGRYHMDRLYTWNWIFFLIS